MACRRTTNLVSPRIYYLRDICYIPVTSISLPGSIRPEFGLTQYLSDVNASNYPQLQIDVKNILLGRGCLDL